jgi:hypothetical protein
MGRYEDSLRILVMLARESDNHRKVAVPADEAAALADALEALRAAVGDAEGQEAYRELKMLQLTRGQVQLLGDALDRLDALTTTDAEQPSPSSGLGSSAGVSE